MLARLENFLSALRSYRLLVVLGRSTYTTLLHRRRFATSLTRLWAKEVELRVSLRL